MNVGKMRHVFNILQPGSRAADGGQGTPTAFASNVRGEIKSLTGSELYKTQAIVENATHLIKMRYLPGVNNSMTIAFGTRTFDIQLVMNPDERTREINMLCVERNSAGA